MPRKIRIALAALLWLAVTVLFVDYTGAAAKYLSFAAKIQFLPALLAFNFAVVIALILLTFLLGRVYCSVICPLGVMQDFFTRLGGFNLRRRMRFGFVKGRDALRYVALAVFAICVFFGASVVTTIFAPYSAYGRIAQSMLQPVYMGICNILAAIDDHFQVYLIYDTDVYVKSGLTLAAAAATLLVLGFLAFQHGRAYCNNICPVGTLLGIVSRHSVVKPMIDTSICINCGICGRMCKGSCIDTKHHTIDYSRCVACMDCIDNCGSGAIKFTGKTLNRKPHKPRPHWVSPTHTHGKADEQSGDTPQSPGRRAFVTAAGLLVAGGAAAKAQEKLVDGGLTELVPKQTPPRKNPLLPAGAPSAEHVARHCTACQLCVSACPSKILTPSTDLSTFMNPRMDFAKNYCRPGCTVCSDVCPTSAIRKLEPGEKTEVRIGWAVWSAETCIITRDGRECGNCARHCPTHAIDMLPQSDDRRVPNVDTEKCIGCGRCEYVCPVRPISAIYVEGYERHIELALAEFGPDKGHKRHHGRGDRGNGKERQGRKNGRGNQNEHNEN